MVDELHFQGSGDVVEFCFGFISRPRTPDAAVSDLGEPSRRRL